MSDITEPEATIQREASFRRGAAHTMEWVLRVIREMIARNRTPDEIHDHLHFNLAAALTEWRESLGYDSRVPDGNPWNWTEDELDRVISLSKARD